MAAPKKGDKEEKDGGEGEAQPLTLDGVKEYLDKSLNGAVGAQMRRLLKSPEFASAIASAVKSVAGARGDDDEGDESDAGDEGGDPPRAAKKPGATVPAEIKALVDEQNKTIRKLQGDLAAERKTRTETEARRQRDEERTMLAEALVKGGVGKTWLQPAIALLLHEEKRVKREKDKILFAHADEDHELAAGVEAWLKTDEGKRFIPPAQVEGSGGREARRGAPAAGKDGVVSDSALGNMLSNLG